MSRHEPANAASGLFEYPDPLIRQVERRGRDPITFNSTSIRHDSQEQINQLRQKRAKAIADARAVYDHAFKSEKRSTLNADEAGKVGRLHDRERNLKTEIDRLERQLALESEIEGTDQRDHAGNPGEQRDERSADAEKRTMAAFGKFLTAASTRSTPKSSATSRSAPVRTAASSSPRRPGWPSSSSSSMTRRFIRQKATKMTLTSAESLGIPSLDTDVSDADWTSEIATGSADSSLKFGKRELKPSPLAKRIKVSNKLIRIGSMPVEALVQQRLGYKFAVTEERRSNPATAWASPSVCSSPPTTASRPGATSRPVPTRSPRPMPLRARFLPMPSST